MSPAQHPPILIADIGGTNARFALADPGARPPLLVESIRRYSVSDFPSLQATAAEYLRDIGAKPRRAVFAIAGHIDDGVVRATNSPWHIVADTARHALNLESVRLINDFAAQSMCLPLLGPGDSTVIGKPMAPVIGCRDPQTFAVIGPGTGLGVGALLLREDRFRPLETEGGHCGYAPDTPEEIDILTYLASRFGHVSNERLISGSGLTNLYQALAEIDGDTVEPLAPEQITRRAQKGEDALCTRTVERFCAIFGSVVGDAVLSLGGWDGAYLAGGLPPLLVPWLRQGTFRHRFEDKGRLSPAMRDVPTLVITHPHAGLLGAAASAVVEAGGSLIDAPTTHAAIL